MIHQVLTVYDSKTEAYFLPFFAKTLGEAIRSFEDAISDPQHVFAKHLEDYTLFHIGEYDDSNALYTRKTPQITLGKAIEFIRPGPRPVINPPQIQQGVK